VATPFYVSPEQLMRDRSEYARKGIARGRSVLVVTYAEGILFVAENPSSALHKVSEIYDRIAFAAVGKYNEFESLRVAGVRLADMRGYAYDRRDVTGRGLANAYAQTLGTIFTQEQKPYEVEIVVAEIGDRPTDDQIYRLTYDGSVADERGFVAMGGQSEPLAAYLKEHHHEGITLADGVQLAVAALKTEGEREIKAASLEVAVLDRTRPRRKFKRLTDSAVDRLLSDGNASAAEAVANEPGAPSPSQPVEPGSGAEGFVEPPVSELHPPDDAPGDAGGSGSGGSGGEPKA
jgi:proteasome alpha subunit